MLDFFSGVSGGRYIRFWALLLFMALGSGLAVAAEPSAEDKNGNRLLSASVETKADNVEVYLETSQPVGYRYTVYDSIEPVRVVIDFPGLDVSAVPASQKVAIPPLQEILVTSLDLPSGRLGRVELVLAAPSQYNVFLGGNRFRVVFPAGQQTAAPAPGTAAPPAPMEVQAVVESAPEEKPRARETEPRPSATAEAVSAPPREMPVRTVASSTPARFIQAVEAQNGQVYLRADGAIGEVKHFDLGAPPRLVVDVPGVQPAFKQRVFPLGHGFERVRVGVSADKVRFVFDAKGTTVPRHSIEKVENALVVNWEGAPGAKAPLHSAPGAPVTVDSVDFQNIDGESVIAVRLSAPADVTGPEETDGVIRFGVKNAVISQALRRTIDASAFPSAVGSVTPYTVQVKGIQNVLFAVSLKGPVPFELKPQGSEVRLVVDDGPFAEAIPPQVETREVLLPAPPAPLTLPPTVAIEPAAEAPFTREEVISPVAGAGQEEKYTGQKISLVFDDADIRKILQLIGEVSDLNILASDDVKGTITLRLIDVPWDQALDLIMDLKGLGMLRQGNVVRIMPQEKIRAMRQAELTAVKEERQLEPLVTEVISVSYTDLKNISGPARELLTDRGKITEDDRNKQIIVTDIASVIQEVKKLTAILDTPERQVMIEARIVEADSSFTRDLGVKWGLSIGDVNDQTKVNIGAGGAFLINPPVAGTVGAAGLGTGIQFGRIGIDSTILDLRISALEASDNGRIISTPRISTLNGGEASISQGTMIPYQSSGADGLPKTEFVNANLELKVKPVINPDNSVIMEINASNSRPGANVQTGSGTAPSIDTKEAKTKMLVRDGETTVIGGIFVEDDRFSETGVPLARKIPILGHLFKSTSEQNTRRELLIFITPRIVE